MPIERTKGGGVHLNIILGDGDLLMGPTEYPGTNFKSLPIYENPDNEIHPVGTKRKFTPYAGEQLSCLCENSISLHFRKKSDIDNLIRCLEEFKEEL